MTTDALVQLRHELHQHPELSGEEKLTAQRIVAFLEPLQPDSIYTSLGGHGVAAVFGKDTSTTVLLRCELDALPCLLYTSPSPRDLSTSRMPSSA